VVLPLGCLPLIDEAMCVVPLPLVCFIFSIFSITFEWLPFHWPIKMQEPRKPERATFAFHNSPQCDSPVETKAIEQLLKVILLLIVHLYGIIINGNIFWKQFLFNEECKILGDYFRYLLSK